MTTKTATGPKNEVSTPVAAFIAGLKVKAIYRLVERGEINPRVYYAGKTKSHKYRWEDLVYLRLREEAAEALSALGRKGLYKELRSRSESRTDSPIAITKSVMLEIAGVAGEIERQLTAIAGMEEWVTTNPEIRGGEPIVKGTRIPVYELAALEKAGANESELLEAFPSVSGEALRSALIWARLNPRRGRPAMRNATWRRSGQSP